MSFMNLNLKHDFAEILRQRLDNAGYPPVPNESDDGAIVRYLNVLNRMIEPRPRVTKKAAAFACPAAHEAGLRELLAKSEAGSDLRAHQSTAMEKDVHDDGLLNDWGIHHFHLGTDVHPKYPRYVSRTGPLLYALVKPDALYCLAVLKHNEWSNQRLLDLMHRDFPELTAGSTLKNNTLKPQGLAVQYTDAEIQHLRKHGINVVTQRPDGSLMMGPGGGVTINKTKGRQSAKVAKAHIDINKLVADIGKEIGEQAVAAGVNRAYDLRVEEKDGEIIASDANGELRISIDNPFRPLG
jgi:hypothetical protein